jgi:polyribonucleotide nucleotidyltransferase
MAHHRVQEVRNEVKEGDQVLVKVVSIDPSGKIRLSRKALLDEAQGGAGGEGGTGGGAPPSGSGSGEPRREHRGDRGDRGRRDHGRGDGNRGEHRPRNR